MRKLGLLLAVLWASPSLLACINEFGTGTNLQGKQFGMPEGAVTPEDYVSSLTAVPSRSKWEALKAELEARIAKEPSFELRNDYGAALLRLGEYEKGRVLFGELETSSPGNYSVASNLGTAYELLGQPDKALHWIKEGIRRNPNAHEGTEWLHVKILEAKLAMAKEPRWLDQHSVAGVTFGDGGLPAAPALPADFLGKVKTIGELEKALYYQLHERLYFIKPPDRIMGDLLFDLGNTAAHVLSLEHAVAIYGVVEQFGTAKPVSRRLRAARLMILKGVLLEDAPYVVLPLALLGLLVAWLVVKVRQAARRREAALTNNQQPATRNQEP